jgi:hypothetical protein
MPDMRIDDKTISDQERLLRRAYPDAIRFDEKLQCYTISSAVFADRNTDGMEVSVNLESVLKEYNLPPESILAGHEGFGLIALTAGNARSCQQIVYRDPLENNPSHALIVGNKTRSLKRKMASLSIIISNPDNSPKNSFHNP